MSDTASDRCEYRLDIGLEDDGIEADPCERPAWEDHDLCVWHATVDGKTAEDFEEFGPQPGDDLDGAYLRDATLVGVDWFRDASLVGADFTEAQLNSSDFSDADLTLASLTSVSGINADFTGANLEGTIFTNADLRRAKLDDALLDAAVFTNVHIGGETSFGDVSVYERDSMEPTLTQKQPLEAAAWAYRQLQQVYRENGLPQHARRSYNAERDARRRFAWTQGDYGRATKWEISRWVMKYGSSAYRVLGVSLLVIVTSALLFPFTGGIQEVQQGQSLTYTIEQPAEAPPWWIGHVLIKSFYFSIITFATLGYGDIQPIGTWARMLAGVETILGSLLSALLVFVLARIVTW